MTNVVKKNLSAINKRAWEIRREAAQKWNCKVMEIVWSECFYMAKEEIVDNAPITFPEWFEFYQRKEKSFDYMLYHNDILQKNGRITHCQKEEAQNTSAFYQILHDEMQDIKQLALVRVMEKFDRDGSIPYKHRWSIYNLCSLNAIKTHIREIMRSRRNMAEGVEITGWNDNNERVIVTKDPTEYSELRLSLEETLTDRQLEIVSLLEEGYNKSEVADIIGISRQAVHKNLRKIKAVMLDNGLVAV